MGREREAVDDQFVFFSVRRAILRGIRAKEPEVDHRHFFEILRDDGSAIVEHRGPSHGRAGSLVDDRKRRICFAGDVPMKTLPKDAMLSPSETVRGEIALERLEVILAGRSNIWIVRRVV